MDNFKDFFTGTFPFLFAITNGIDPKKVRWIRIIESLISGVIVGAIMMWGAVKVLETKTEYMEKTFDKTIAFIMKDAENTKVEIEYIKHRIDDHIDGRD